MPAVRPKAAASVLLKAAGVPEPPEPTNDDDDGKGWRA
jgi:hypothetical protein